MSCTNRKTIVSNESLFTDAYYGLSDNKKIVYLDSIVYEISNSNDDSLKVKSLFEIAAEYYYLKDKQTSLTESKKIFELSKNLQDSVSMGRSLYYIGDCYEDFQKDSAYYYYKEAEKLFRLIGNNDRTAKALFNKAHLLFTEGNYIESEVEVIKALTKLKDSKNFELLYNCHYLQASIHIELDELENAEKYLSLTQESLNKLKKSSKDNEKFYNYTTYWIIARCNVYDKKGEYSNSITALKSIASNDLLKNHPDLYSLVLGNLAYAIMKNGDYKAAKKYYDLSIKITKEKMDLSGYLYKIINYGEYHLLVNDTIKAQSLFKEAVSISRELKAEKELLKALNFLSFLDKNNSTFYKNEYVKVVDSLGKRQRLNSDKFARIEYETGKVIDANRILTSKNLQLILLISISIIVFIIVFFYRYKIAKKKELLLLEQKSLADDELNYLITNFQSELVKVKELEQDRISKELHDGVMNQIYGVRMNLGYLNSFDDNDSKEKRLFLVKELQQIELEIRDLSHELNVDTKFKLADFDFLLNSLVKSYNAMAETSFIVEHHDVIKWDNYTSIVKLTIYRVLQELFLNVVKHASAKKCTVVFNTQISYLIIKVYDDGVGFDILSKGNGIGLKNIDDRLQVINAELLVSSKVNLGTEFTIKII